MAGLGDIVAMVGVVQQQANNMGPVARGGQFAQNRVIPNNIPSPPELLSLYSRARIPDNWFYENMANWGYSKEACDIMIGLYKTYLSAADYISLWRRGEITEESLNDYFDKLSIPVDERRQWKKITQFFPTPNDLIRFAVREVYTPETVEKFRMDEDLPEQFIIEAAKAGLPEDQARNFWRSHWDLPSAQMGFVMYQRRIITYDDLIILLRSLDIMPFWRDKLIQLAFSPLTRVDVRRMYGEGVLSEEQLPAKYQDLGYNEENAQLLSDFTVKYENREIKGVTRAQVIQSYKDDLLTDEELLTYLQEMGYSQLVINFWWQRAIFEKAQDDINLYTEDLIAQYLAGGKDLAGVRSALDSLDIPSTYTDKILRKIVTQKGKSLKVPSKEDLSAWLASGIIDEVYFTAKMRMLHYDDEDIQHYLEMISKTIDTSQVTYLDKDIYIRWAKNGTISPERFRAIMRALEYSEYDLEMLCREIGVEYAQP